MKNLVLDHIPSQLLELPVLVQVMALLSLLFLTITFILFSFILISRFVDNLQIKRKRFYEIKVTDIIISYLFDEEEWNSERLNAVRRQYLGNRFLREVFLSCLTKFQINIIGKDAERLKSLYIGLKLHERSLRKLNSKRWAILSKGIIELAEMDIKKCVPQIRKFINHNNPIIRAEAQVALIQLQQTNPFDFLYHLKEPLLDWQQVQLAHVSEQLDAASLPKFKQWLNHKEESVVVFCLRMISLHNQRDASDDLINMLYHQSNTPKIQGAVIFAIGQLDLHQTIGYLESLFPHESPYIRQEVVNTLGVLNSSDPEDVLKTIHEKEKLFLEQFYYDTTVFIPNGDIK